MPSTERSSGSSDRPAQARPRCCGPIAGIEHIHGGSIVVDGRVLANRSVEVPPEERRVGDGVPERRSFSRISAPQTTWRSGLNGRARPARATRAQEMLERVELADVAERLPHTLSGGEAQRVALARASRHGSGCDVARRAVFRPRPAASDGPGSCGLPGSSRFRDCRVLVGHNPEDAMRFADRISVMHDGRVLQLGTPEGNLYPSEQRLLRRHLGARKSNTGEGCRVDKWPRRSGQSERPDFPMGVQPSCWCGKKGCCSVTGLPCWFKAFADWARSAVVAIQPRDDNRILHARVPADSAPAEGTEILVRLDPARAFVFPMDG